MNSRLPVFLQLVIFLGWWVLFSGNLNPVSAQRFHDLKQAEDTLSAILASINHTTDDSAKSAFNATFLEDLSDALQLSGSDEYPFESLKTLIKITSPDKKFRFLHWNLPQKDGRHRFYGLLQILNHEPPLIFPLTDRSDSPLLSDTLILDSHHWPGALYYKIIPVENAGGETFYTLLGWSGKNQLVTRKLIEILTFDTEDLPIFGRRVFPDYLQGNNTRIIFHFAANTTMSMKYEKMLLPADRKWNTRKREFDITQAETDMIVCERMVPLDPLMEGQYQYYVSTGDLYDGFACRNHVWNFIPDIDIRKKK